MARFPSIDYTSTGESPVAGQEGSPQYCAFPGVCESAPGDVLVAYMRASDHASSRNGNIKLKASADGGVTFGTEITVADTGQDLRDPDLVTLSTDAVLCTFTEVNASTGIPAPYVAVSTDHGATFGTPIAITHTFTERAFICGRAIELPNGDLLTAYYGKDSGDAHRSVRISRSTDGGAIWAHLSEVVDTAAWGREAVEPVLAYDPFRRRVLCAIRSDTGTAAIFLFTSDDAAVTWSAPSASLFNGSGRPALYVTHEGIAALAYRDTTDSNKVKYRFSGDGGDSWGGRIAVNSSAIYEYASWWQRSTGHLLLAWAVEMSSTDARVQLERFDRKWPLVAADVRYPLTTGVAAGMG